ncbi:hypothetical protein M427DRAFT_51525 [Gonapodya prolifera JEL478]|uniref:Uncharacterized protein n=1 Tax=Gonapodya prolifera (strain JEL478) TaxID=1344416 RepID=A0A139AX18_GONPJ|nr:hypothetical protein M427DRAFT_51525 [Gonapodya prolifera JEL478]|eukprot:KXS21286.1 hypothetical protein M427DRAFT_51525 [Gonapodya prolifera JEL478]
MSAPGRFYRAIRAWMRRDPGVAGAGEVQYLMAGNGGAALSIAHPSALSHGTARTIPPHRPRTLTPSYAHAHPRIPPPRRPQPYEDDIPSIMPRLPHILCSLLSTRSPSDAARATSLLHRCVAAAKTTPVYRAHIEVAVSHLGKAGMPRHAHRVFRACEAAWGRLTPGVWDALAQGYAVAKCWRSMDVVVSRMEARGVAVGQWVRVHVVVARWCGAHLDPDPDGVWLDPDGNEAEADVERQEGGFGFGHGVGMGMQRRLTRVKRIMRVNVHVRCQLSIEQCG